MALIPVGRQTLRWLPQPRSPAAEVSAVVGARQGAIVSVLEPNSAASAAIADVVRLEPRLLPRTGTSGHVAGAPIAPNCVIL